MPVPDDWWIVAGDIRNSTTAIESGQYKQVNMVGASLIAAVCNLFKEYPSLLPHVFGGDGATLLAPNEKVEEIQRVLRYCRAAARECFELDLCVGMVQVREVRDAGFDVRVARLKLSDTIHQTIFRGNGLPYAESVIKGMNQPHTGMVDGDLTTFAGLECRWQEIPPGKDEITTYIIKASGRDDHERSETYQRCLAAVNRIYGSGDDFNPLTRDRLKFTFNPKKLSVEWRIRTWGQPLKSKIVYAIRLLFQLLSGRYLMKRGISTSDVDWGDYKGDLIEHADFRKFGDGLRFVATGTTRQREVLKTLLQSEHDRRTLNFGIHSSGGLMITCYVTSYQKQHIHFVDGSDGGYAMAAKMLKQQVLDSERIV